MPETASFTRSDVVAAKRNDLAAIKLVTDVMLPIIDSVAASLAGKASRRDLTEDAAGDARLYLWKLVADHDENDTSDKPIVGLWVKHISGEISRSLTESMSPGMNPKIVQRYLRCLEAAGRNHELAVEMAQNLPGRDSMSRDMALTCMNVVQGIKSLDAPVTEDGATLTDFMAEKPLEDSAPVTNPRRAMVHETLDQLAPRQAGVLRDHYLKQLPLDVIAEDTNQSFDVVSKLKQNARRSFWQRFPFERAYGGVKPALVAEHKTTSNARGEK